MLRVKLGNSSSTDTSRMLMSYIEGASSEVRSTSSQRELTCGCQNGVETLICGFSCFTQGAPECVRRLSAQVNVASASSIRLGSISGAPRAERWSDHGQLSYLLNDCDGSVIGRG